MRRKLSPIHVLIVLVALAGCAGSPDPVPDGDPEPTEATPPEESESDAAEEPQEDPAVSEQDSPTPEESEPSPPLSETAASLEIRATRGSFSPELSDQLVFRVSSTGDGDDLSNEVERWDFVLVDEAGDEIVVDEGTGSLPDELDWDGSTGNDDAPPDGRYTPRLEVTFRDESSRSYDGRRVLVDTSDPIAEIELSGVPFRPGSSRGGGELIITIDAEDASPIVEWAFEPRTLEGETLASFSGESDVPRTARWNGRSGGSVAVESGKEYLVWGWVRDDAGNEATTETRFPAGAITEEYRGRDRIVLPRIEFPANSSNISTASPEALRTFERTVRRVARILSDAPDIELLIEGHANSTEFTNGEPSQDEQENELVPLSQDRAEVVRQALIERGIDGDRLQTEGVGASDPVVDFSTRDSLNRNRRIELYIVD